MRRDTLNFVVDAVTLLAMLLMVFTGLLMEFVLPPRRGRPLDIIWGMDRHEWGDVHFWTAVVLVALLVVHVALHWKWVCAMVSRFTRPRAEPVCLAPPRIRNAYGVGFLTLIFGLVGGFLWFASVNVQRDDSDTGRGYRHGRTSWTGENGWAAPQLVQEGNEPRRGLGPNRGSTSGLRIRGSTTLGQIEQASGIQLADLLAALNLPETTPPSESLARLRGQYDLRMSDVRAVVEQLRKQREHAR